MSSNMKMVTVDKFLGINEAADGYTELKMGQASRMENWAVTDAYNLKVRPGIQLMDFDGERPAAPVLGAWAGYVEDREYMTVVDFREGVDRIWMFGRGPNGKHRLEFCQEGALGLREPEEAYVKIFTFNGRDKTRACCFIKA